MRLNASDIEIVNKILDKDFFREESFSRVFKNISKAWGVSRRFPYNDISKTLYLKNFEDKKNHNPIYNVISAALYSFSILATLLIINNISKEDLKRLCNTVSEKTAEVISKRLGGSDDIQEFLKKSFYLSFFMQIYDENNIATLQAMHYLYEMQYIFRISRKNQGKIQDSPAHKLRRGKEADVFKSLACILEQVCEKNKISFDWASSSRGFNRLVASDLGFYPGHFSFIFNYATRFLGLPATLFGLATLWLRNYINLPWAILTAGISSLVFKYKLWPMTQQNTHTILENRKKIENTRLQGAIKARQEFLVAEYEQEQEQEQEWTGKGKEEEFSSQPFLLFAPMRREKTESRTFEDHIETHSDPNIPRKSKKIKTRPEAGREQEHSSVGAEPEKDQPILPDHYYLTNYRNQVVIINPRNITLFRGGELDQRALNNISYLTQAAKLCLYKTTTGKFEFKVKRGRYDRTAFRLFAKRTEDTIDVEGRGTCQVYEVVVYTPKH